MLPPPVAAPAPVTEAVGVDPELLIVRVNAFGVPATALPSVGVTVKL